jgi:hypothetical protein
VKHVFGVASIDLYAFLQNQIFKEEEAFRIPTA